MTRLFLTIREASEAASIAETTIRAACQSEALTATDIATPGGRRQTWRIAPDDLTAWVREGAPTKRKAVA